MQADLKVGGQFDGAFVSGVRPLIERLAAERRDVVIDVSETAGLDAEALIVLTYMHKRLAPHGHKVRIVGASDELIRFFEDFHLAGLFIEEELTAAPYWRS
ncbi:MAG: STAS domain-containing protein [Rhodomicrobium sp.]